MSRKGWLDKILGRKEPTPAFLNFRCGTPHLQSGGFLIAQTGNVAEIIRGDDKPPFYKLPKNA